MNDETTKTPEPAAPPVIKHLIGLPLSALHDGTLLLEVLKYEASILVPLAATISPEKLMPVMEGLVDRLTDDLEKTYKACGVSPRVLALEVAHAILTSTVAGFTADKAQGEQETVAQLLIGLVAHSIGHGQKIGELPEFKEIAEKLDAGPAVNPFVKAQGSPNAGTA